MATNVTNLFEKHLKLKSLQERWVKNPPRATEMWQPHQDASGARKKTVRVTT